MPRRIIRGLKHEQEQDPNLLIRDTRTLGQRIKGFFQEQKSGAVVLLVGAFSLFLPGFRVLADLILVGGTILFVYSYGRRPTLPFRLPKSSYQLDYNDLDPKTNKPLLSDGICFYGNERDSNKELWFSNIDMRTHSLIFGATGSGKTEFLLSLLYNSLVQGSGAIYVDGKGDNTLFSKIFSMVHWMRRTDDLLVVNFMTGARDIIGPQARKLSNTLNPFSTGSSSMLAQLIVSLMDESKQGSSDSDMWKGRAIAFVEALMKLLVYMRDQEKILLDVNVIRNYFSLDWLEMIVADDLFPRTNEDPISIADIPATITEAIKNYVQNLPGYNKAKKGKQVSQVLEQHGFITMQLTRVFTSLADTYGHILRTDVAEVDLRDVVLNRRILVVLLPALEKSPAELSNLGKVIISSLKAMMAAGLGEDVEGEYSELITRKPTNAPSPFVCILDEYGYYAVQGFAVVPAQARSLGFAVIFAAQDLPSLQKASKEEAASIGANTNIKIAMKLEDPLETWDFFSKTAGESLVTKVDAFQTDSQSISGSYRDTRSSSSEKRARVDLLDLKDQGLGEAHIFFKSLVIRAKVFYANPANVKEMRLNHFLKVAPPSLDFLLEFKSSRKRFAKILASKEKPNFTKEAFENDLTFIVNNFKLRRKNEKRFPHALKALKAIYKIEEQLTEEVQSKFSEPEEELIVKGKVNIFTKISYLPVVQVLHSKQEMERLGESILSKTEVLLHFKQIGQLMRFSQSEAHSLAHKVVTDLKKATEYPPHIKAISLDGILKKMRELIDSFG